MLNEKFSEKIDITKTNQNKSLGTGEFSKLNRNEIEGFNNRLE